jgi:hypothetical protein
MNDFACSDQFDASRADLNFGLEAVASKGLRMAAEGFGSPRPDGGMNMPKVAASPPRLMVISGHLRRKKSCPL